MGTYLKVWTNCEEDSNFLNQVFRAKTRKELCLFPTQKELEECYVYDRDHHKPGESFPSKEKYIGQFWNWYFDGPNVLNWKISYYEEEDLEDFKALYEILSQHYDKIKKTKEWARFLKELNIEPNENDLKLIDAEKAQLAKEMEELPKDQQNYYPEFKDAPGKGIAKLKTWGISYVWVMFGNVETPQFLKEKVHVNDLYNKFVKDKYNNSYVLIPLIPLGPKSVEVVQNTYQWLWEHGIREEFFMFINLVYPNLCPTLKGKEVETQIDSWTEFYANDLELLNERFERAQTNLNQENKIGFTSEQTFQFKELLRKTIEKKLKISNENHI